MLDENKILIDNFSQTYFQTKSEKTKELYMFHLTHFFNKINKSLSELTINDIGQYLNEKDKEIIKKVRTGNWEIGREKLSTRTKNCIMSIIISFLNFNKKYKLAKDIKELRSQSGRRGHREPIHLTPIEVKKLLSVDINKEDEINERNNMIVKFLYETGMRAGELCKLKVGDLDLNNISKENKIITVIGKGNFERKVIIPSWLLQEYKVFLNRFNSSSYSGDYLFLSRRTNSNITRPVNEYTIWFVIKEKAKKAGIIKQGKAIHPHKLRSTFITELHKQGEDLLKIQALAGHMSPTTTKEYVTISEKELKETRLPPKI